jgi:hypothetical protein
MDNDCVEWIIGLFNEIEEPTPIDRVRAFSLLLAEAESWNPSDIKVEGSQ